VNVPLILAIGCVLGALGTVGIYADPHATGKLQIVVAGAARGALAALLTGYALAPGAGALAGLSFGAVYGAAFGAMICLSKGAGALEHVKYIMPIATVMSALAGVPIAWWGLG
jgi:hypothetical protein